MNKDDKLMMVVLVSVRHRELAAVLVAVGDREVCPIPSPPCARISDLHRP